MANTGVGDRVRAAIADSGLTQREVGRPIGLDETKLSKSLSGRRRFTAAELLDLATVTGATVHGLLGGPGPAAVPEEGQLPARHSESAEAARTRREIVDRAWWLFAEHGYDGVQVSRIAEEVGVATATVHYYFPTKRDIFVEVLRYSVKLAFDRQSAQLSAIDDPLERLRTLVRLQSPVGRRGRAEWSIWLQVWNSVTVTGEPEAQHGGGYRRWWTTVREIVAEGQRRGGFREQPLDEAVDALTALIDGLGVRVLTGMATADQMAQHIDRYIDRNLRPLAGSETDRTAPIKERPCPSP